jgi:phospholipase/carboxylesterase
VLRVGYPDPATFAEGFAALAGFVDSLPYEKVVIGGFSQGAVMSLAVGLGEGRPRARAVIAFSGFIPVVEGWRLDAAGPFPPIALSHGTYDGVIPIEFAHRSLAQLETVGAEVLYRESPIEHAIEPAFVAELRPWLRAAVTATGGG